MARRNKNASRYFVGELGDKIEAAALEILRSGKYDDPWDAVDAIWWDMCHYPDTKEMAEVVESHVDYYDIWEAFLEWSECRDWLHEIVNNIWDDAWEEEYAALP